MATRTTLHRRAVKAYTSGSVFLLKRVRTVHCGVSRQQRVVNNNNSNTHFWSRKTCTCYRFFPIIYLLLMVVDRISNSRFATFIRQKRQIATTTSSTIKDGVAPSLASIPGDAQKTEIENGDKKQG